ncbi:hypothetical protein CAL26_01470 [Bordetella genomosp. 9]|uniref:Uncharacterized protein n=1 Tax=Bordetella genomosp. 9 TaxID=1416803 RepID=A0A261RMD4_9BORD|nr:hypothetical protein [Bordetella genomosp. 9]OZI26051.1 hypothetical protein CAL26_01470 [Bordetella genomosp. 9]
MKLDAFRRWGALLLALAMLFTSIHTDAANAPTGNQADVQLKTDLTHMVIQINQGAPLPPGGCNAEYAWHTVFGGCRRAVVQSEAGPCPAGYIGSSTRYRTAYILQANANDVAYDPWGAWQNTCARARASGVIGTVLAQVRGTENGETFGSNLPDSIEKQMQVGQGTLFGVTIDRSTATLVCAYASGTTPGGGESSNGFIWSGQLLSPGESLDKNPNGACLLSDGGRTANLTGNCDSTSGGDNDFCVPGTHVVRLTSVTDCTVVAETDGRANSYDICQ